MTQSKKIRTRIATDTTPMARLEILSYSSESSSSSKNRLLYPSFSTDMKLRKYWLTVLVEKRSRRSRENAREQWVQSQWLCREYGQISRGRQKSVFATIKHRKMSSFDHVTRHNSLCNTIKQGTVEGDSKQERQQKRWSDNVKELRRLFVSSALGLLDDCRWWN